MYRTDKQFMRNPATAPARIYIGNLPENVINQDLEEKFKPHGKILGLVLQKGFGFIQFDTEGQAQAAIAAEHGSSVHNRKINVRQALEGKNKFGFQGQPTQASKPPVAPNKPPEIEPSVGVPPPDDSEGALSDKRMRHGGGGGGWGRKRNERLPGENYRDMPPYYPMDDAPYSGEYVPPPIIDRPERNDCEIIVVSKSLTEYAEYIEQRLKSVGLIVDLLFPNDDVPIGRVLANISSRGCLYAILVMPQNEEHRSLTLNLLHGIPQEHRNMPTEDALILITRNFDAYMRGDKLASQAAGNGCMSLIERHPEGIQMVLNLLAENRQLTTVQYDRIIKYLQERRELQKQQENMEGEEKSKTTDSEVTDTKQAELQSRIMNILNKGSTDEPPKPVAAQSVIPAPTPLLNDPSVQKALDSLLGGDMFMNMSGGGGGGGGGGGAAY